MAELEKSISNYIQIENLKSEKFALALSGGADSMSLYKILLKIKKPSLVIHINHGMRKESIKEADLLYKMVKQDDIKFILVNLENIDFQEGNIEDRLRKLRYTAFEEILRNENIYHIFTGHQKDDAEETIFKRILEGSSIFSIPLFLRKKTLREITIHRPLINFSKNELIEYLKKENNSYFEDYTNFDTRFLRAKMRLEIFPYLNEKFGKNIKGKFFDLAKELIDVEDYFNEKCQTIINSLMVCSIGVFLPKISIHSLELKYVVKKILSDLNQTPSKDALLHINELALKKVGNKKIVLKDYSVFFEKSGIFFIKNNSWKINFKPLEGKIRSDSIHSLWLDGVAKFRKEDIPSFLKKNIEESVKSANVFLVQIE